MGVVGLPRIDWKTRDGRERFGEIHSHGWLTEKVCSTPLLVVQ